MTLPMPLPGLKRVLDERRCAAAVQPLCEAANGPICQPKSKFAAHRLTWSETHQREDDVIIRNDKPAEQIGLEL